MASTSQTFLEETQALFLICAERGFRDSLTKLRKRLLGRLTPTQLVALYQQAVIKAAAHGQIGMVDYFYFLEELDGISGKADVFTPEVTTSVITALIQINNDGADRFIFLLLKSMLPPDCLKEIIRVAVAFQRKDIISTLPLFDGLSQFLILEAIRTEETEVSFVEWILQLIPDHPSRLEMLQASVEGIHSDVYLWLEEKNSSPDTIPDEGEIKLLLKCLFQRRAPQRDKQAEEFYMLSRILIESLPDVKALATDVKALAAEVNPSRLSRDVILAQIDEIYEDLISSQ